MAIVYLKSSEDSQLAPYRDLSHRSASGVEERFVVEGRFLVERLLASELATESILTDPTRVPTLPAGIDDHTTVYVLPKESIDQLVGFEFHRGLLACGLRRIFPPIGELVPAAPRPLLMVVCSQIGDPANLGGVLRNCLAFGASAVLLGPGCADPFSRRVLRVSMGAVFQLPIALSPDLTADLRQLTEQHHVTLVATVLNQDAEPLAQVERFSRVGLVMGNEGFGLSEETVGDCARQVTIPIRSSVDSLNVAVASGLFLYHFSQRSCQQ